MSEPRRGPAWSVVIGYAIGFGLCGAATLGVWLQYSSPAFTALSGAGVGFAAGVVVGGGWALIRPRATRA